MIVTFLTPMLKLSGGVIVLLKYAEGLAALGHQVYIVGPGEKNESYIKNGVTIKTFKRFGNNHINFEPIQHKSFYLIYLKSIFDPIPNSDVVIPIFFPLVIHARIM